MGWITPALGYKFAISPIDSLMLQRNIVKIDLNPECVCLGGREMWNEREGGKVKKVSDRERREGMSKFL